MKRLPRPIRLSIITLGLLATVSIVVYAARRAWPRTSSEVLPLTVAIHPRDFTLKISANGELQSSESLTIAVPFVPVQRLRIATVVADGRPVSKGDVLVEFDPAELDLEALEHHSSLEMTNQKITKGEMAIGV